MHVEFNHLYITLNANSVESINESVFLDKEFCNLKKLNVKADGESWTGTYLVGKQSYLELFAPGGAEGLKEGYAGIGFNTVQIGQIDEIEKRLEKMMPGKTRRGFRNRKTDDGEIPWFHYLHIEDSEESGFSAFLMEFHPKYLESKGIALPDSGFVDRGDLLTPKTGYDSYSPLFYDISDVELELSSKEHEILALLLRAFGYESSRKGRATSYRSNGFNLMVTEAKNPTYRLRKAICSLSKRSGKEREMSFSNKAMLSINNDLAYWLFGPNKNSKG